MCNIKNDYSVIMYPYSDTNPYQYMLANALERKGYFVHKKNQVNSTMSFFLISYCPNNSILHLHWIGSLYEGRTIIRFIVRTIIFCITLVALRLKNVRIILTLHNLVPHDSSNIKCHLLARKVILKCVNDIIVHSEPAREVAIKYFGSENKYTVILHGTYRGYYKNGTTRDEARSLLSIPDKMKVILFFGAIKPYKNIEAIIRAADYFKSDNFMFVLAGNIDDHYKEQLSDKTSSNVLIFGSFVRDDMIQYYMNASDALILPYQHSLTSGAAILGLSYGVPIIGTNATAFEHLIKEDLCISCNPTEPKSISDAIKVILSWDKNAFKDRCDKYLSKCSWDDAANQHARLYRQKD
jgi:beta-1,4-mannosyltransferase